MFCGHQEMKSNPKRWSDQTIQETLRTKLSIAKDMTHVKSLLLKRSVTGQEDTAPHLKGSFRCALCTVFTASRRTVYKTCSLIWNANSARKLEAWCWGVHRLARFNVQNLRKYDKSMEFLRFGSKIHLFFFFPLSHLFGWKIIQWMENFCKSYCRQRRRHRGMPKNCYQTRLGRKRSRRRTFWDRRKSIY